MVVLDEFLNDPDGGEPDRPGLRADLMSAMLDGIAEQFEMLAVVQARISGMMCEALRFAVQNQRLFTDTDGDLGNETEWARRALTAELAAALHLSERKVESLLATSETLVAELPGTLDALRRGEITTRHAELMVSQSTGLGAEDKAQFERAALPLAKTATPPQFTRSATRLRERLNPETITERKRKAASDRRLEVWNAPDGMGWLALYAPVEVTQSVYNVAQNTAKALKSAGDERTRAQIAADAFTDALMAGFTSAGADEATGADVERGGGDGSEGGPSSGSGSGRTSRRLPGPLGAIRPTVHVTVPVLTLLGASDEPAELEGYGPIDPETARRLAAQAPSFTRLLVHPETGAVLSVGRDRYSVPADLRKMIEIRDETCGFAGCNKPAHACDIDHRIDWQFGGETSIDNLSALCRSHHRLKHETRWSVDRDETGRLVWSSPLGRVYVVRSFGEPGYVRAELDASDESGPDRTRDGLITERDDDEPPAPGLPEDPPF